jgi:hypothetical protein
MTRRNLGAVGSLLVVLVVLPSLALPAPGTAAVPAREADSFVESIGVNVHTGNGGTPYRERFEEVEQRLQELGVHHVRDDLESDSPAQHQELSELAGVGIESTVILGDPGFGSAGLDELIDILKTDLAGAVEAVEGPNEFSTSGDSEWKPHLIAYQQQLYDDVKGDPALSLLPVIGPSIVHGDQDELGDVSGMLDYGNIHSYPQGNPPDKLGSFITRAELNSGSKPILATETGYNTALNWTGENRPVSEAAMATYMPRLFFEYFRWGIVRTYSYELVDELPDPNLENKEWNFGLLRNDLSRKPAFEALRNTIAILEDPGPAFVPGSLSYRLRDRGTELPGPESTELHKVLLQKRDGSFYLAMWRLSSVWDAATGQPLAAPSEPVTVTLEPGLGIAAEYRPNLSPGPFSEPSQPSESLTLDVGPEVVIMKIVPAEEEEEEEEDSSSSGSAQPAALAPAQLDRDAPPAPAPCIVPELRGRRLAAGRAKLKRAACRLGRITGLRTRSSRVVKQRPRPGRLLAPGSKVNVRLD